MLHDNLPVETPPVNPIKRDTSEKCDAGKRAFIVLPTF